MAITHRNAIAKGATPSLGAAGHTFVDAAFGSRMARVTDGNFVSDLGTTNRSFRSPSSGYQQGWNADGTKLYILHGAGEHFVLSFNRTTMATARWGTAALAIQREPVTWDPTNPNLLYGVGIYSNAHTLVKIDVTTTTPVVTVLLDLDTVTSGLNSPDQTYVGALTCGNGILMCTYGGLGQEYHHYVLHYPLADPGSLQVLDTLTRDDMDEFDTKFSSHGAQIDKSGRFIDIVPTGAVVQGRAVAPHRNYIWDTQTNTVTPITANSGGHEVLGWRARINADTLTTFDSTQWILTPTMAAPNSNKVELINPLLSPVEVYASEHTTWNNAKDLSMEPVISGVFRVYDGPNNVDPVNTNAWRTWDGEIVSITTTGAGATVTRFCHHRSLVWPEVGVAPFDFWYTPRSNVDNQGQFVMFTSNWDKTLGLDSAEGNYRQDVFIVELAPDGAPPVPRTKRPSRRFR